MTPSKMPNQDQNKKILKIVERAQKQLGRLQNELGAIKAALLKERQDSPSHVPSAWEWCYSLYDEIMQEESQSDKPFTLKEIHSRLTVWKKNDVRDKRLARLPDNPATFSQYVRGFMRARGLQTHRQRK